MGPESAFSHSHDTESIKFYSLHQEYRIGPIVARSWILDGSLLYVYIVGGGPFDTACAQARLKNENRMSLL